MVIKGVKVTADPALTAEEIAVAVRDELRLWQERGKVLGSVELSAADDSIIVKASEKSPIRRVRRITGYLSTIEQFNDAKRAECSEREIHML